MCFSVWTNLTCRNIIVTPKDLQQELYKQINNHWNHGLSHLKATPRSMQFDHIHCMSRHNILPLALCIPFDSESLLSSDILQLHKTFKSSLRNSYWIQFAPRADASALHRTHTMKQFKCPSSKIGIKANRLKNIKLNDEQQILRPEDLASDTTLRYILFYSKPTVQKDRE